MFLPHAGWPARESRDSRSADLAEFWKCPGGGLKHGACAQAVIVHLPDKRRDAVEFQFITQIFDKGDIERLAIQVGVEIEQEDFKQRRAVVEGRPPAVARDAVEALRVAAAAKPDTYCIDAVLEIDVRIEPDVRGGIAKVAPALLAMDDGAADEPRSAEHGGRVADAAFGERATNGAGRNRQPGQIDMRLNVDLDAEALALFG